MERGVEEEDHPLHTHLRPSLQPSQQQPQVHPHYSPTSSSDDFHARPFNETTHLSAPPPQPPSPPATTTEEAAYQDMGLFDSPLPMPLPETVLSLSSHFDFQYVESMMRDSIPVEISSSRSQHPSHALPPVAATPFSKAVGTKDLTPLSFCNEGRMSAQQLEDHGRAGGDRRHKRMMKNRESAARSRARKQAYTNELELEVATLSEKNSKLTRRNEELLFAKTAHLLPPTKNTLQRCSTAPF